MNQIPLIAFDVDLFLDSPVPAYKIFSRWTRNSLVVNSNVECLCLRVRQQANVVLLSQYELWQNKLIKDKIDHACYNYFVSTRDRDEFEMFEDNMLPYLVISNIPKIWGGENSGVIGYRSWTDAFDSLREEICITEVKETST